MFASGVSRPSHNCQLPRLGLGSDCSHDDFVEGICQSDTRSVHSISGVKQNGRGEGRVPAYQAYICQLPLQFLFFSVLGSIVVKELCVSLSGCTYHGDFWPWALWWHYQPGVYI